jgi:hypothetical protein
MITERVWFMITGEVSNKLLYVVKEVNYPICCSWLVLSVEQQFLICYIRKVRHYARHIIKRLTCKTKKGNDGRKEKHIPE